MPSLNTRLPRATKLQPMPTLTKSLVRPSMSSLASQRPMHMVEMVMLADVAAPSEGVVDSKTDKDPRADEEILEDKTVAAEVLQLLEEVGARVRSQTHEPRNLSLDPQERRCIPHVFHSATSAMYHTYFGHGFFFVTRPRPCTLLAIFGCRSSHSMHSRHTSFSSFICNFPFC